MSRDQKPGRIRVISGGQQPNANAAAGSRSVALQPAATPGTGEPAEPAPRRRFGWGGALVFLGSCAIGGAGFIVLSNGF